MTKPPHLQQELHHEQDRKKLDVTFSRKNEEDNNCVVTVGALVVLLLCPLPSGKLVVLAKGLNLSTLAIMMSVCTATVEARL